MDASEQNRTRLPAARDGTAADADVSIEDDFRREVADILTCAICQEILIEPVTLACGHTFDRACLEQIRLRAVALAGAVDDDNGVLAGEGSDVNLSGACVPVCPFDRKSLPLLLPHVNLALQAMVRSRFPDESDALEAERRARQRDASGFADVPSAGLGARAEEEEEAQNEGPRVDATPGLRLDSKLVEAMLLFVSAALVVAWALTAKITSFASASMERAEL
eukprot:TRINITY_DN75753_c0_g1_i1.p1 TRINITY_DN75753_c0_g1~~TRINITY_DN75753_c0_g1_i1.p1  ORF type:complete len:248 (-),score=42.96 TRINITY_DN75753_c0_g1_i1:354-1019(-)